MDQQIDDWRFKSFDAIHIRHCVVTNEILLEFWARQAILVTQICCLILMKLTEHLEQIKLNVQTRLAEFVNK